MMNMMEKWVKMMMNHQESDSHLKFPLKSKSNQSQQRKHQLKANQNIILLARNLPKDNQYLHNLNNSNNNYNNRKNLKLNHNSKFNSLPQSWRNQLHLHLKHNQVSQVMHHKPNSKSSHRNLERQPHQDNTALINHQLNSLTTLIYKRRWQKSLKKDIDFNS